MTAPESIATSKAPEIPFRAETVVRALPWVATFMPM